MDMIQFRKRIEYDFSENVWKKVHMRETVSFEELSSMKSDILIEELDFICSLLKEYVLYSCASNLYSSRI